VVSARIQNVLVLGDDRFPRHRKISRFLYEAGDRIGVHVITRDVSCLWDAFETLKDEDAEERQLSRFALVDQLMRMVLGFEIDHVISLDASSLLVPDIFLGESQPKAIHHLWLHPLKDILRFWEWDQLQLGPWHAPLMHEKCKHYYLQDTLQILPGMTWSFMPPGAPRQFVDLDPSPKQIGKIACELDPSYLPGFDPECLERLKSCKSKQEFLAPFERLPERDVIPFQNLWYLYTGREDLDIYGAVCGLEDYGIQSRPELDPYDKNIILSRYRAQLHLMSPALLGPPYERIPETMAMGSVPILLSPEIYVGPWQGVVVVSGDEHWETVRKDFQSHSDEWHMLARKDQVMIETEGLWEHRLKTLLEGKG
jgi:hypothetical protein